MKTLEIKMKVLAAALISLALLLGVVYLLSPRLMAAAAASYEKSDNKEAAMIVRDRLIRYFPWSDQARAEAFRIGEQILSSEQRILVGPTFSGGGGVMNQTVSPEKAIAYLQRVSQAERNHLWKYNGFGLIGELQQTLGDFAQAEYWFLLALKGYQGLAPNYEWKTAEITGKLIELYLENQAYDQAEALIGQGIRQYQESSELAKFYSWQGDLYYAQGNFTEAKACYSKTLELETVNFENAMTRKSDLEENLNVSLEMQPGYRHAKNRLDQIEAFGSSSSRGQVQGVISVGSSPLANVQVYLINEKEYDGRANHLEGISSQPPAISDAAGRFSFANVTPGRYFIVLAFLPQDLEDVGKFRGLEHFAVEAGKTVELDYSLKPRIKIIQPAGKVMFREGDEMRIAWEAVPDAASYNLHLTFKMENGYVGRVFKKGLRETSFLFAPRGLELREMNFVTFNDAMEVGPSAILGSFYPGAQIYLHVEAVDEKGRSISDSEGYVMQLGGNYPWVEITAIDHLSAGDRLLLDKKYAEAISAYEQEIAQDPADGYALLSLARLYHYGWSEGTADSKQALSYYQKLLNFPDIPLFILEEAASAATAAQDYSLALQIFSSFEERMEPGSFLLHWMGELYFQSGRPEKAIEYYGKYLQDQDELVDLGPVIALLYVGDTKGALNLLQTKSYSQQGRYTETGERIRAADTRLLAANLRKNLDGTSSVLSPAEFKEYLLELMQISGGKGRTAKVEAICRELRARGENDILVQTLLELALDRY